MREKTAKLLESNEKKLAGDQDIAVTEEPSRDPGLENRSAVEETLEDLLALESELDMESVFSETGELDVFETNSIHDEEDLLANASLADFISKDWDSAKPDIYGKAGFQADFGIKEQSVVETASDIEQESESEQEADAEEEPEPEAEAESEAKVEPEVEEALEVEAEPEAEEEPAVEDAAEIEAAPEVILETKALSDFVSTSWENTIPDIYGKTDSELLVDDAQSMQDPSITKSLTGFVSKEW